MSGREREFMSKMERADATMGPPRDQQRDPISFLAVNHSSMHDFWRINTANHGLNDQRPGPHDHHMTESTGVRGGHAMTETHHLGEYSLGPYNAFGSPQRMDHRSERQESSDHVVRPMDVSHSIYSYANLVHPVASYAHGGHYHNSSASSSSDSALHAAHATYTNFFNSGPSIDHHDHHDSHHDHHDGHHDGLYDRNDRYEATDSLTTGSKRDKGEPRTRYNYNERNTASGANQYHHNSSVPVATPAVVPNHFVYSSSSASAHGGMPSGPAENINRDIEAMRRELAWKCPQSNDILTAITSSAEAAVQDHRNGDGDDDEYDFEDDDDEYDPPRLFPLSQVEQDQGIRAAIIDHPYYQEMVAAHIRIFKIGAPKDLSNQLDDIKRKFQKIQRGTTKRIGDDYNLDVFMRSYVDMLVKLGDDIEAPFNEFIAFKDETSKQLEEIMGHYVETNPDESDNYGLDIVSGPMDAGKEMEEIEKLTKEYIYDDIDESIVIDPSLPDADLKKLLRKKYGRHIGALKAEFGRVKKKGKLPSHARSILKEWFNHHSYWPYPTEGEKNQLHRMCSLNLKQINNWFINERKRHWSCEGKCMHPNAKLYNSAAGQGGDKGHCHD